MCCSHDDLAEWLRDTVKNHLAQVNLSGHVNGSQADIPRLLKGKLGAQVSYIIMVSALDQCTMKPSLIFSLDGGTA